MSLNAPKDQEPLKDRHHVLLAYHARHSIAAAVKYMPSLGVLSGLSFQMHNIFTYFHFIFSADSLSAPSQHRLFIRDILIWKDVCFGEERIVINIMDFPFLISPPNVCATPAAK